MSFCAKITPGATKRSNIAFLEYDNYERHGTYTRLHYEDRKFSNLDELQYANRIAVTLKEKGIRSGDCLLTVMPNTPELTATFQAVWTIGAVIVPVNPLWTAAELAYALSHSGAVAVLTIPMFAARIREASTACRKALRLLCFGETGVTGFENIAPEVACASSDCTPVDCAASNTAMVLYTSGTTARPKGVAMTHENIPAAMDAVHRVNPSLPRRPILHVLPWQSSGRSSNTRSDTFSWFRPC